LVYGDKSHFQQYFSDDIAFLAVSFIDGWNRSCRRKPSTCPKSLTNISHNVASITPRHERG